MMRIAMADTAFEKSYVKRPAYPRLQAPAPKPSKATPPAAVAAKPRLAGSAKRPDPMALAQMLRLFSRAGTGGFLNRNSRATGNNP